MLAWTTPMRTSPGVSPGFFFLSTSSAFMTFVLWNQRACPFTNTPSIWYFSASISKKLTPACEKSHVFEVSRQATPPSLSRRSR